MRLDEALYSYLSGTAALTALVGLRIYPVIAPESASAPYLVLTEISKINEPVSGGSGPDYEVRYQVSVWADTYASARAVAVQVSTALKNYSGTMGGAGGVVVSIIYEETESEFYEPTTEKYHIAMDYLIWHQ